MPMTTETNVLELQTRANTQARLLIDGLRPEHLAQPTPCSEWNVRALLNHLVALHLESAAAVAHGPSPDWSADHVGDDPAAAFAAAASASEAAFRVPGVLDRSYRMPWGETSGEALAGLLMMDTVIHSWDLAAATSAPTALDPELCEDVLARGQRMMRPEYRTPEAGFGPALPIGPDAPACDRLAAFFGRQP